MLQILINDCNKMMQEHNNGKRHSYPHWKDHILLPLAREIGMQLIMQYEVTGVFGLRLAAYISIKDESNHYMLCITPRFKAVPQEIIDRAVATKDASASAEIDYLCFDTGKDAKPWDANGSGKETKRLLNDIGAIIEILKANRAA